MNTSIFYKLFNFYACAGPKRRKNSAVVVLVEASVDKALRIVRNTLKLYCQPVFLSFGENKNGSKERCPRIGDVKTVRTQS